MGLNLPLGAVLLRFQRAKNPRLTSVFFESGGLMTSDPGSGLPGL
jgi:hypothetical protein